MGWHGPKGNCGCCGCGCPSLCECYDRYTLNGYDGFLGYVTGHEVSLSGLPAMIETEEADFYGFEQFNDTFSWSLPSTAVFPGTHFNCQDECYAEIITTKNIAVKLKPPYGTATCNLEVQLRFYVGRSLDVEGNTPAGDPICGFGLFCTSPSGCGLFLPCGLFFEFLCFFLIQDFSLLPPPFGGGGFGERGERKCVNFAEGTVSGLETGFFHHRLLFQCRNFGDIFDFPLTATLAPIVRQGGAPILGWNYNVSNVPSSFYLRISNSTESYQITGMDVINGDYELELDDESDCTKRSVEFLSFDISAQEFAISTASPCTIVPVGATIDATAILNLPPSPLGVVVTIRIPGENDKSILIDDWVPFGCEAYEDDAYIDHELTECFGNPDPILTLSKTAILG